MEQLKVEWEGRDARYYWPVALVSAVFVCGLLYGQTLFLPLFFDDLVQMPFVARYSILEHWISSNESPYYRPLTITVWKLLLWGGDPFPSQLLHGLNLVFHGLSGILAGWLAHLIGRRFSSANQPSTSPSPLLGWGVCLLYLIYPFHYQAVPWVGAYFHILVTTFVLIALIFYLHGWLWLPLAAAFLAPFVHENGVAIFPMILLLEVLAPKRNLFRPFLFLLPLGSWFTIRLSVSTAQEGEWLFSGWESIGQSFVYFLQGLGWPGAILGADLVQLTGLNDLTVAGLTAGLAVLLGGALFVWQKELRLALFGLGFWLLASFPALIALPFSYNVSSPRLLTLAGVGAAIFWGGVVLVGVQVVRSQNRGVFRGLALAIVTLFAFAQLLGYQEMRSEIELHHLLGDAIDQAAEISRGLDQDQEFPVFINFPSSASSSQKWLPLGNQGVVMWPGYAPPHTIISTNQSVQQIDQAFVRVDSVRIEQPILYGIVDQGVSIADLWNQPNAVFYQATYSEDGIQVAPVGQAMAKIDSVIAGKPELAAEAFQISLLDVDIERVESAGVDVIELLILWRVAGISPADVTVFVHGVSGSGELINQADGDLLGGAMPLSQVADGAEMLDIRTLDAAEPISHLRIGLYNRATGERLPLFDENGERYPDNMFQAPVEILLSVNP